MKHKECLLASQINQIHNLFASKFHNIIGILIVAIKTACQFHKSTFIAEINGGHVCNDNWQIFLFIFPIPVSIFSCGKMNKSPLQLFRFLSLYFWMNAQKIFRLKKWNKDWFGTWEISITDYKKKSKNNFEIFAERNGFLDNGRAVLPPPKIIMSCSTLRESQF